MSEDTGTIVPPERRLQLVAPGTRAKRIAPIPLPLVEDRDPWERQPKEAGRAHACFVVFRDMGIFDRSTTGCARLLGVQPTVIKRMRAQWSWDTRADAWDDDQRRNRDKNIREQQEDAIKTHGNASRGLLGQVIRLIQDQQRKATPDGRALRDAAIALDKAIHHNRLALGLPTDVNRQDLLLRQLLDETLQAQEAIMALIQEVVCDDCRTKVGGEIRRVTAKTNQIRKRAS